MKTLIASALAIAMLSAGAANAGIGAHVGPLHIGIGVHHGHHRHCDRWDRHHRDCRRWR